ncbi:hypothetical protein AVEN_163196-1 [Araneus ventricosus]|uniref:Reverse transcriptase Ty1/copia-type domain-containing protein n=1 Tax=Araneus ventricosus TaxID=182803 RepID=A0A4Y2I708_ARAVE|nr:hypothetical protein AVEN_163196-1 [Araneus ventricosus]
MEEEIEVMKEVWELVPTLQNSKAIGCRWVYALKKNEKGEICRYKASLVAQGNSQQKGETYEETSSPVVNFSLARMFFVIFVSMLKWTNCQLAVLYAKLKENIYIVTKNVQWVYGVNSPTRRIMGN